MTDFGDMMVSGLAALYDLHGEPVTHIAGDGTETDVVARLDRGALESMGGTEAQSRVVRARFRKSELSAVDEGVDRLRVLVRGAERELEIAELVDETDNEWVCELR